MAGHAAHRSSLDLDVDGPGPTFVMACGLKMTQTHLDNLDMQKRCFEHVESSILHDSWHLEMSNSETIDFHYVMAKHG